MQMFDYTQKNDLLLKIGMHKRFEGIFGFDRC